jgi:hypothetical protein
VVSKIIIYNTRIQSRRFCSDPGRPGGRPPGGRRPAHRLRENVVMLAACRTGSTKSLLTGLLVGVVAHRAETFGLVGIRAFTLCLREAGNCRSERVSKFKTRAMASSGQIDSSRPSPLNHFLLSSSESIKNILDSGSTVPSCGKNLTLVIGNEASDLDSMASSVLFAYACSLGYLDDAYPQIAGDSVIGAVMNIPRDDYVLRQVSYQSHSLLGDTLKHVKTNLRGKHNA